MSLFKKMFGLKSGQKSKNKGKDKETIAQDLVHQLIEKSGLELSFETQKKGGKLVLELKGKDKSLLIQKDGKLLAAFQLFVKRVLQHQGFDSKDGVFLDCGDFRKKSDQNLLELAKKLKNITINRGAPVYFKALSPRDRKLVHQFISEDSRVKSTSIGEGMYKRIKIFPVSGVKSDENKKSKNETTTELNTENFL